MKKALIYSVALSASLLFSVAAHAEDYVITIKNSDFSPKNITVPAGQKIKLTVKNLDTTPAEFESSDLDREKVVNAGSEITVFVGPLDPGNYGYFNDFHQESTGTITAK